MTIAFLGILVPMLALISYLSILGFSDNLNTFMIVLIATMIGVITTVFLLNQLLYPISLISTTLHQYLDKGQKPNLPACVEKDILKDYVGEDSVGQLMTEMQYLIQRMDLLNRSLDDSSTMDPLTGTLNRSAAKRRLYTDVARARREDKPILIVLLDINKLKSINDQFGHQIGDACIIQVAKVLSQSIRESDWLARWDGDKFLMALWNFQHITPTVIFMRIQQQSVQIPLNELQQISLSIGAYEYKGNIEIDTKADLELLLRNIEEVLSEVKKTGGGGIILKEPHQIL
ncbi:GGDEF domain-containing protein [Candidatus Parabeggiatoa sp. HSG14]|uniref:GGDEF domain-containing protein n=1 Tax=Candidatus Parabeggiatoa sp. HSG14 TaxID=3055593 RepID=UPI0025A6A73E|nr:GGDEF domain-containing protein [Thiotrichales bacterium HSG14]